METEEEKEVKLAARRAVRRALKGSGLTLKQLARHWGLSESTLSRISTGRMPSAAAALKIHLAVERNLASAQELRRRRADPARSIGEILKSVAARDRLKILADAVRMVA